MKYLPLICLCGILFLAILLSARFSARDVPASAAFYMWVVLFFHAIAAWGLQRDHFASESYRLVYAIAVWGTTAAAIPAVYAFNRVHPPALSAAVAAASFALATAEHAAFRFHLLGDLHGALPKATALLLFEALLLSALGMIALLSLAANLSPAGIAIRLALGGYMAARGALMFTFAAGAIRNRALWQSLNGWLPAVPGILAFGLLALFLILRQGELSRQQSAFGTACAAEHMAAAGAARTGTP